jgi:hypothetical protein
VAAARTQRYEWRFPFFVGVFYQLSLQTFDIVVPLVRCPASEQKTVVSMHLLGVSFGNVHIQVGRVPSSHRYSGDFSVVAMVTCFRDSDRGEVSSLLDALDEL